LKQPVINNKEKITIHTKIYLLLLLITFSSSVALNAQNPQLLTNEAKISYGMNDLNTAITKLNQAIELDSSYTEARILLGQIYLQTNQPKHAEEILKPALTFKMNYPEVLLGLGIAYFEQKRYTSSLMELRRALSLDPNNVQASEIAALCYLNLGVADYQNGLFNGAISNFNKSIGINHTNIQAYQNLVVVLYESGKRQEAIKICTKGLSISPKEKILLKIIIQCYAETNKIEEALEPAQKLYKYYPNDVESALQLAYIYRYSNRGDEAFGIYEKMIEKYPSDQRIYDEYAELHSLRGEYSKAINTYEKFLNHTDSKSLVHQKIAEIYLREEKFNSARLSYKKALKSTEDKVDIYCSIADTYVEQNNNSLAIGTYREGLENHPQSWKLHKELASIYEPINIDSAVIIYNHMIQIQPSNPFPSIRLAALFSKNNDEEAIRYSEKAIELHASTPEPYFILAGIHLSQKDSSSSINLFKQSVQKSLKEISRLKKIVTNEISNSRGRINLDRLEFMGDDVNAMEKLQRILRSSLQFLLNIEINSVLENYLTEWLKEYSEETVLFEFLAETVEKQNDRNRALSIYEQLIRLNPKIKEGHLGYARINEKNGKFNSAISAYKRALTIDSKDPEIFHKLISLHIKENKVDQLCEDWLLRTKREPENKILLSNLRVVLKKMGRKKELNRISEMINELENSDL
jgi:tetratricopeptide (TPR) repeat protein